MVRSFHFLRVYPSRVKSALLTSRQLFNSTVLRISSFFFLSCVSFVMNRTMIVGVLLGVVVATIAEQKTARVHLVANNVKTRNVTGNLNLVRNEDNSVRITGKIHGLTEGLHGIHVHEKGDLRDGCASTGPHFNPENVKHGGRHSTVRHVGDLGNVRANEDGEADVDIKDFVISFAGKNNIVGRAIVVHSGEDDLGKGNSTLSATTGNSGDRWACGVIEAK